MEKTITVCDASENDIQSISSIHNKSWKITYANIIDKEYLDQLTVDDFVRLISEPSRNYFTNGELPFVLIAKDKSNIIGTISIGMPRDKGYKNFIEIHSIYIDNQYIGSGVGRMLFNRAFQYLLDQGVKNIYVKTLKENVLGRNFYLRMGGKYTNKNVPDIKIGEGKYPCVIYEWLDINLLNQFF